MPRRKKALADPAAQVVPEQAAARDKPPERRSHHAAPKVTAAMASGVVEAVQSLGLLIGHMPADAAEEKAAATAGLLAACRKSPLVRRLITGGVSISDYGVIAVGLGGLVGRIGLDLVATARPDSEPVKAARARFYQGTGLAYQLFAGQWPDFSQPAEPEPAPEVPSGLATGGAPGSGRNDGVGQDVPGAVAAPVA
jgi:hypothetical protein